MGEGMVVPLRRHQLAHLCADAWTQVLAREWDAEARACLDHWASHRLPLVVTRQAATGDAAGIALGLPAPTAWGRRRLALQVPRTAIVCFGEFPRAAQVRSLLPRHAQPAWRALTASLAACRAPARVYGSHGWQQLSGLRYLRPGSDVDLWIAVDDAAHADTVASLLQGFAARRPRLDGELVFDDGSAVHWREWLAWRSGQAHGVLVKRLNGAALASQPFVPERMGAMALAA